MHRSAYLTIISIIGYVVSILVFLYPRTMAYIESAGPFYQIVVLLLLVAGPAVPIIVQEAIRFHKRQTQYNLRLETLQKREREVAAMAAAHSLSNEKYPSAEVIRSLIRALNNVCFDAPPADFREEDWRPDTIRIPLYDDILVDPKIRYLVSLPIFQRLRYVRQLSFAYLLYPGAVHCRMEHALGTYFLTKKICESLKKDMKLSSEDILFAEVAALIHDVGHSSMGHGLEPLCTLLPSARDDKRFDKIRLFRYLEDDLFPLSAAIDKIGLDRKKLLQFFRNPEELHGKYVFLNDVIDSDVDVDRIDYLNRDAYHANGPVARIDHLTLVENACHVKTPDGPSGTGGFKLVYLPKAAQAAHVLLIVRDAMYAKVYESDIKTAAEEMLCHALYSFYREYGLNDEDLEQILRLSDGDLMTDLHLFGHDYEKEMIESIISRQVFSVIGHFRISDRSGKDDFKDKLYELARQLKATGFEEKIRIETVFCKQYLKQSDDFPIVFIRAPEELTGEKTEEQIRKEESKKPAILVDGRPVLLETYLSTRISTSPERTTLRIYSSLRSGMQEKSILNAFEKFVSERGWKL